MRILLKAVSVVSVIQCLVCFQAKPTFSQAAPPNKTLPGGPWNFTQMAPSMTPPKPEDCDPTPPRRGHCDNLASQSCNKENELDGTFKVSNQPVDVLKNEKQTLAAADTLTADLMAVFQKKGPSRYFYRLMLSFTNLSEHSECKGILKEKVITPKCLEMVRRNLNSNLRIALKSGLDPQQPTATQAPTTSDRRLLLTSLLNTGEAEPALKRYLDTLEKFTENTPGQKKVLDAIPRVKESLVKWIHENVPDKETAAGLSDKVAAIQFKGFDCSNIHGFGSSSTNDTDSVGRIPALLIPNAYYAPEKNHFRYCSGFLQEGDPSLFDIYHTIAHELAHALSPNFLESYTDPNIFSFPDRSSLQAMEKAYPIPGMMDCVRDQRGYRARRGFLQQEEKLPAGVSDPTFMYGNEQAGEAISDVIAGDLLPELIEKDVKAGRLPKLTPDDWRAGFANAVRKLNPCSNRPTKIDSAHPSGRVRANQLATHSKVRELMGCSKDLPAGMIACDKEGRKKNQFKSPSDQYAPPPGFNNWEPRPGGFGG